MKKLILIILLSILLISFCDAQIYNGYAKGIGVGVDNWYKMDNKSDFKNINLSYVLSSYSESTLFCPYISFGHTKVEETTYKRENVFNDHYLWEFGTSILFQVGKHWHFGVKGGAILDYNRYKSFNDNWTPDAGVEIQFNFNSNYKGFTNTALYVSGGLHSFGVGIRHWVF
jgi:hypothetical protein